MDFPQTYQSKDKVDPISLFDAPTIKKESKPEVNEIPYFGGLWVLKRIILGSYSSSFEKGSKRMWLFGSMVRLW